MPSSAFTPAIVAAVTDVVTSVIVRFNQPDYPLRFLVFQIAMIGLALVLATPFRPLWVIACVLLMGGVILAGFSVGFFYVPRVAVAGWVMVKRLETQSGSFVDAKPQKGVIYTESELEAMRNRQSRGNES